ncbi:futalosine hydrolase [Mucilaginibacter litoreus]|uniref:Futalosine hydrolase n=1 Tax=Mucilaginibacter litoreus TaxID=1048221 RepID=A0ABW3AXH9_9SPHI
MRVLFVAATPFEVKSLKSALLNLPPTGSELSTNKFKLIISGVGMVATAYTLGKELSINKYDLAVNLGIAGSFDRTIPLGDIVEIIEDNLAELGAEDDENFLSISQLGFGESLFNATANIIDFTQTPHVKKATAITVNTVHGNEASISKLQQRHNVGIESMEGAAFFYACREANVPCMQIRAISNYVEKRNRSNWQIGLAIKNLNDFAISLLNKLNSKDGN